MLPYFSQLTHAHWNRLRYHVLFFFFNDTATTEIYTLSLHDALPIFPAAAEHRRPHGEPELPLHERRDGGAGLLVVVEAPEGVPPGLEPLVLVLAAEEAFVDPDALEVPDQIVRGDRLMARLPAVVFLHRLVQRRSVDDPVIPQHRDAQDVDVLVLERTRRVVVDLPEGDRHDLAVGANQLELRVQVDRRRVTLHSLDDGGAERLFVRLREVERLEDEAADLPRAGAAVVPGARQVQVPLGARHPHVAQPALLLQVEVPARQQVLDQRVRERDGLAPAARGKPVRDQPDHEDNRELQPLGLMDRQDM